MAKTTSIIGLDIGVASVKYAEITMTGQATQLHRVSILPLKDQTPASVKGVLKTILSAPLTGKRLHISVSGPAILIRRVTLPLMTAAELKGAIRFEAENHLPVPVDDCILDFQILTQNAQQKQMTVLLVAAQKTFIMERLKTLDELKLRPDVIDVDIFCLINAFDALSDSPNKNTYGILDIGHHSTTFAIVHEKKPFFVREITAGGDAVSRALADMKKVAEEEANRLKIEKGVDDELLKAATQKGFEPLVDELRHSIDYFENETGEDLKTIWLSGGGALSTAGSEILSQELGKEVSLWDNTKKLELLGTVDKEFLSQHRHELNIVFGMILRGVGNKK